MDDCPGELGCYEFGGYRLDAIRRVICSCASGRRLVVAPKTFDAALYFVQHPGRVLSKEELLAALWPGLLVEENGLTQLISALRAALGETRGENRFIVTVPRRGYCFVAPVLRVAAPADPPPLQQRTVAVLPFDNWSSLPADDALAAGIAESILHRLAGTPGIRLVAQTSSFAFRGAQVDVREVGRRLDARYVIEGSLQRADLRLRVTAQLIDTTAGTHVWSLMFKLGADDVFSVEDHVAQRVTRAVRHSLVDTHEPAAVPVGGVIGAAPARRPQRRNRAH
jgi:TolB-like protein